MKPVVVDTFAILSWLDREQGFEAYAPFLTGSGYRRAISLFTLFELKLAFLRRELTPDQQGEAFAFIKTVCDVVEVTEPVAIRAAEIRFKYMKADAKNPVKANISMADAVMVALAESMGAPLLSGDKGLRQVNEVKVVPERLR